MVTGGSGARVRSQLCLPGDVWLPVLAPRHPGDPVPDVTLSRLLRRAAAADLGLLAEAANRLGAGRPVPRAAAVRTYLGGLLAAITVHCRVEDSTLCPLLLHRAGPHAHDALTAAAADHAVLAPRVADAIDQANAVVELDGNRPAVRRLAFTLHEIDVLLRMHSADHELRISPLIRRHLTVDDHVWLQRQFHRNLPGDRVGFVVPWLGSHASAEEWERLAVEPHQHVQPVERIFRRRFDTLRALALGDIDVVPRDAPPATATAPARGGRSGPRP